MTRERAKELLPIMKAFSEGKDILYNSPLYGEYKMDSGNLSLYDKGTYSIVEDTEPLDNSLILVGTTIQTKDKSIKYLIIMQAAAGVELGNFGFVSYKSLLDKFMFLDGSPCGRISE